MKKDKPRDIARGVLPSTARKGARDNKRGYHRKHRATQREANHNILRACTVATDDGRVATDVDLYDDFEDREIFDGYAANTKDDSLSWDDMNYIVSRRRDADKLGPLLSWARAIEKRDMVGWHREDKRAYFKAVLPDTLQGRHALGHIESALDLDSNPYEYGFWRYHRKNDLYTFDDFRNDVNRHLSGTKSRIALRDFIYKTVPVAAHHTYTNNKIQTEVQARDENGRLLFTDPENPVWDPVHKRMIRTIIRRPIYVTVLTPQVVSTTCDKCSVVRNSPLGTPKEIEEFIQILWNNFRSPWWKANKGENHILREHYEHFRKVVEYIKYN